MSLLESAIALENHDFVKQHCGHEFSNNLAYVIVLFQIKQNERVEDMPLEVRYNNLQMPTFGIHKTLQ